MRRSKTTLPNRTIQHAGVITGIGGVAGHAFKNYPSTHSGYKHRLQLVQNFSAVTAACLVVEKEIFQQVGGFDEENLKVAFNDVDFCLKVLKEGYRNIWTPHAIMIHHESASRGLEKTISQKKRFESENPTRQKITKTDLAKFQNIWKYKPALVCRGVQKNFVEFSVILKTYL